MIEKKLETYSHEELIQLENGIHAAIKTFQKEESEPHFEETQDLLLALLIDIVGAQRETLFPDKESPEWRSYPQNDTP